MKAFFCIALLALVLPARAVELSLVKTNIAMPAGRSFQMPVTASDAGGGVLTFSISSSSKAVTGTFSSSTNRSVVLNVTGVDATNATFTGDIVLQLFEDLTPVTTARFVDLVSSNFYDGQPFRRVIQDFIGQVGNTNGNTGVSLDDEYVAKLIFTGFGQLAFAKNSSFFGGILNDTADSEFFITDVDLSVNDTNKPSPRALDLRYPIFGQMTRGFDVFERVMSTPVTGQTPVMTPIVNTATIVTNSQDTVLHLAATANFTGNATVTITARNASGETATQTLHVNVIANTINDPPFFGSIPASIVVTQYAAASFTLDDTDLDNDPLTVFPFSQFPTNYTGSIDSLNRLWLVPDINATGTVTFTLGLRDNISDHSDSQSLSITVIPRPETPTLSIALKSGSLLSSLSLNADRIKVSGSFTFTGGDHVFKEEDIIVLTVGDPSDPINIVLPPDVPGHKLKNGILKYKSNDRSASAQFNPTKGTFKFSVSQFSFPTAISNEVQVGIAVGDDAGSDTRAWTQKKPGNFVLPKP